MRAFVPQYEMQTKSSLSETLTALAAEPGHWKVFAGGTDLMVQFESGKLSHTHFLNLAPFQELRKIEIHPDSVRIGALCTYADIQKHPVLQKEFPLMTRSGWVTGAKAIQNRGTLGGNIANASPAADTPPSLLAYGAKIELMSHQAVRALDYAKFHLGYKKTELQANEIISAVILPRQMDWTHHYYRKVGTRAFQSISKVAFSMAAKVRSGRLELVQIGLASVAPMPTRALDFESVLQGKSADQLVFDPDVFSKFTPIDDIRSTAPYRRAVLRNLGQHLIEVLQQPPGQYLES
jgi:CO/xanthine dehydrogenase FAD-binding subunit